MHAALSAVLLAPSYDLAAAAIFARMTVVPSATRKRLISNLVRDLKNAGVWAKLDVLYVLAAHDAQAARLNWKGASFDLTAVNSPTFLADRHYVGDGVSMHLTAGVNWNALTKYTQDNNSIFAWCRNDVDAAADYVIGGAGASSLARLNARATSAVTGRTSSSGTFSATLGAATSVGLSLIQRTGAAASEGFKNGVSIGTDNDVSGAPAAVGVALLRDNAAYSTRQLAAAGIGASLSAAENLALYNALATYMTAVGA